MMKNHAEDSTGQEPAFGHPRLLNRIRLAAEIWEEISRSPHPADRWLGGYFFRNRKKLGSHDRRFLSETIYGAFRHKLFLEAWVLFFGEAGNSTWIVLLSALIAGMLSSEETLAVARMEEKPSGKLLTGGMIRRLLAFDLPPGLEPQNNTANLSLRYSFPEWLLEKWMQAWGESKTKQTLEVFHKRSLLSVRNNPLKIKRDALLERWKGSGQKVFPARASPLGILFAARIPVFDLQEFKEGLFEVQDTGSQLVCLAIDVHSGESVWDVCAGGGGKSLLLAALMENKGRVVATDIREKKLEELKKRARRGGVFNIFPADLKRMDSMALARKGFDRILVDAPCSGTGTLRRNPDAKWKMTPERFEEHRHDQLAILKAALPYLKKGGKLYYVTCSLEKEENEQVLDLFLAEHPQLRPVSVPSFGEPAGMGQRLWPGEENDGFFLGVVEKI